ncbi:MAG: Hpt domain-containing protein, partial [Candidatus Eremiobacteraeota bacterium]|nr:Hpt domain-containing protein [Candidatus Eremiobacteraeota bacterium]
EAHKLKGAIANFESPTTNAVALELESMGEKGDLSRAAEVLIGLEHNLGALVIHLEGLCREQAAETEE